MGGRGNNRQSLAFLSLVIVLLVLPPVSAHGLNTPVTILQSSIIKIVRTPCSRDHSLQSHRYVITLLRRTGAPEEKRVER